MALADSRAIAITSFTTTATEPSTEVSKQAGVDDAQGFFGLTAVWTDIDGNGRPDLFVANDGEPNYLYRNNGDGTFTNVAEDAGVAVNQDGSEQANMGVAIGDYNHTGRFSIAITHFSDEYAALFRNDGPFNFTDVSYVAGIASPTRPYVGWGDAFVDLDNDGWADFFMVNGHVYPQVNAAGVGIKYREPALLFQNMHDGTFRNISQQVGPAIETPQVSRGLAVGDLFNDGHMEIVIENLEGAPMILRPEGGPQNDWISLTLQGNKEQPPRAQRARSSNRRRLGPNRRGPQRRKLHLTKRSPPPLRLRQSRSRR